MRTCAFAILLMFFCGLSVAQPSMETDLLIVGGPTNVRGLSRRMTRSGAIRDARESGHEDHLDPDAEGPGLRDWFDALSGWAVRAAAFDTRADMRMAAQRVNFGAERRGRAHRRIGR